MFFNRAWYDAYAGKIVQFNARAGGGSLIATDFAGATWMLGAPTMKQLSNFILPLRNEVLLLANYVDTMGLPQFVGPNGSIGRAETAAQCIIEPQYASPSASGGVNIRLGRMYVNVPSGSGSSSNGAGTPLPMSETPLDYPWTLAPGTSMFTLTLPASGTFGFGTQGIVLSPNGMLATKSSRVPPTVFECLNGSLVCMPRTTSRALVVTTTTGPTPSGVASMFSANMQRVTVAENWQLGLIGPSVNPSQTLPEGAFTLVSPTGPAPALVDVSGQGSLVLASLGPPANVPLAPFNVSRPAAPTPSPIMQVWATALGTMPFHATPVLPTPAIIGISVGAVVIVAVIVIAAVLTRKRKIASK